MLNALADARPPRAAHVAGRGPAGVAHRPRPAVARRLHRQGPVDAGPADRRALVGRLDRPPRSRRPPPADPLQPARGAARGGLLDPGARPAEGRPARRGADRGERARRHAAGAAPRRPRSDVAAPHGHGGNPRRRVRVRPGSPPAAGEPRRRAAAGAARRAPPRSDGGRAGTGRLSRRRQPLDAGGHLSGRHRTLGGARGALPPGRPPARAARPDRRQPVAARRGAPGVAAAHSRHRPRDQQLAGADQVDCRQPRTHPQPRPAADRLGGRHAERSAGHRHARRFARPVHGGVRAAGEAARSPRSRRSAWLPSPLVSRSWNDAGRSPSTAARLSRCWPIPISSSSSSSTWCGTRWMRSRTPPDVWP